MITVVIPLYNKEKTIQRCLQSVLDQQPSARKILIVNDGSTDASLEKAQQLAQSSNHFSDFIEIIDQDNAGVSAARNAGLAHVETEFVAFLDADDEWKPHFVKEALALVERCPKAHLYGFAYEKYDEITGLYAPKLGLASSHFAYVEDFFDVMAKGTIVNSSSNLVRTQALRDIGGFPVGKVSGEDLYVWLLLNLNHGALPSSLVTAFSGKISSRINQLEDQSRDKRQGTVPYVLEYFGQHKAAKLPKSAVAYVRKTAVLHILESIRTGNKSEAKLRLSAVRRLLPITSLALRLVMPLPLNKLLSMARTYRRARKKLKAEDLSV